MQLVNSHINYNSTDLEALKQYPLSLFTIHQHIQLKRRQQSYERKLVQNTLLNECRVA